MNPAALRCNETPTYVEELIIHQIRQVHHSLGRHWSVLQVVNLDKHGSCSGYKSLNVNIFLPSCLKCCGAAFLFWDHGPVRANDASPLGNITPDVWLIIPEQGLCSTFIVAVSVLTSSVLRCFLLALK